MSEPFFASVQCEQALRNIYTGYFERIRLAILCTVRFMAKTKIHQGTGNRSREKGPAPILYDIQNRIKNVPTKLF